MEAAMAATVLRHFTPVFSSLKPPSILLLLFSISPPETYCPVPPEQRVPISLFLFPFLLGFWRSSRILFRRLGASFAVFVGLPVCWFGSTGWAYVSYLDESKSDLLRKAQELVLCFVMIIRISASNVFDEETGWYDCQIWVKTLQVLARDRLLGSFSVKPVLALVILGLSLILVVNLGNSPLASCNRTYRDPDDRSSTPNRRSVQ